MQTADSVPETSAAEAMQARLRDVTDPSERDWLTAPRQMRLHPGTTDTPPQIDLAAEGGGTSITVRGPLADGPEAGGPSVVLSSPIGQLELRFGLAGEVGLTWWPRQAPVEAE